MSTDAYPIAMRTDLDGCCAARHVANFDTEVLTRAAPSKATRPRTASRAIVWIVEDDRAFSRVLAEVLRAEGYEPREFAGGRALLESIAGALVSDREPRKKAKKLPSGTSCPLRGAPRLVVSDIRMPGPSGLDLASGLRELTWLPPIVLMTAFGGEDVAQAASKAGACALLEKPFDMDEFRALVMRLAPIGRAAGPT